MILSRLVAALLLCALRVSAVKSVSISSPVRGGGFGSQSHVVSYEWVEFGEALNANPALILQNLFF